MCISRYSDHSEKVDCECSSKWMFFWLKFSFLANLFFLENFVFVLRFLKQGSITSDKKRNIRPGFSGRSPRGMADRVASSPRSAPPAKRAPSKKEFATKFKEDVVQGNTKQLDDKKVDKWLETPSKVVTKSTNAIFHRDVDQKSRGLGDSMKFSKDTQVVVESG